MSRKQSRETIFQLIFEYTFLKKENTLSLEDFLLKDKIEEEDKPYITTVYNEVISHYEELISTVENNLKNYTLNRIYKVDLAILVLAVYELKYSKETPSSVVINEAVELSKKYSTEKSFSFINGVLASILGKMNDGA